MYYIGIDVGGTNLVAGLVDTGAHLVSRMSIPADRTKDADGLIQDMIGLTVRLCEEGETRIDRQYDIKAIGIGIPGQVDNRAGTIVKTVNMPLSNTNIRAAFQTVWGAPVFLGNDANCAALGAYWAGAARGCDPAVMVTLGTGVGGGMVSGGRLFDGFAGSGMEVGHMITHAGGRLCTCGNRGCWEQYGSATALIHQTIEAMESHPDSLLWQICGGDLKKVEGRTAFDAASQGDAVASGVLERYREHVAVGLISLVNMLQPEIICIGGGISNASDEMLMNPLRKLVLAGSYDKGNHTRITRATLGNDAGIIGAALLCRSI